MLSTAFLTHPEAYDQVNRQECVRVDLGTGVTQKLSTDFIRVVHQTSRNAVGRLKPTREFESLHMKLIFKNLTAPVTLAIDLFSLICIGIISCSAMLLRLVSGIIGILGIAVLVTYSPKNGLILLTIAFLFSPMGLPMIAVWILSVLQGMSGMLKSI